MAGLFSSALAAYLLALSFTDSVEFNVSTVDRLVDYKYNLPPQGLLPSTSYNGSIDISWAVPGSALPSLEGRTINVKVAASAGNQSPVSFPSQFGVSSKTAEAYLRCEVVSGACTNSSVLFARIPFEVSLEKGEGGASNISITSEIVDGAIMPDLSSQAGGILDSFKEMLSLNQSQSGGNNTSTTSILPSGGENFLDSLKPEGDSQDPVLFLKENPLISLAALAVVIVITGAYLLNSKD